VAQALALEEHAWERADKANDPRAGYFASVWRSYCLAALWDVRQGRELCLRDSSQTIHDETAAFRAGANIHKFLLVFELDAGRLAEARRLLIKEDAFRLADLAFLPKGVEQADAIWYEQIEHGALYRLKFDQIRHHPRLESAWRSSAGNSPGRGAFAGSPSACCRRKQFPASSAKGHPPGTGLAPHRNGAA